MDLEHSFPKTGTLFRKLSFRVEPGIPTAIVGPSGSGKSTLLSIIAGWQEPLLGRIQRHNISSVNWVFQNPHGVARRSALDHVVLPLLGRGLTRPVAERQARQIMATFGLDGLSDRQFRQLSGGEAQRLRLARAVSTAPDLLLVDEPTAQLDPRSAAMVNSVLAGVSQSGAIVLIATHDQKTRDACSAVIDLADFQASNVQS